MNSAKVKKTTPKKEVTKTRVAKSVKSKAARNSKQKTTFRFYDNRQKYLMFIIYVLILF